MFKIEGDYKYINVSSMSESTYINGQTVPTIKYTINASYELHNMMDRLKKIETEWMMFKSEHDLHKQLIESNPAVREAYKNYLTMAALAKESQ